MYEHDGNLKLPYDTLLSSSIYDQGFKNIVAPILFNQINLIRKQGNAAVHTPVTMTSLEALHGLKLLYGFIAWLVKVYGEEPYSH
jgi:type I restriction enzyme R subunit